MTLADDLIQLNAYVPPVIRPVDEAKRKGAVKRWAKPEERAAQSARQKEVGSRPEERARRSERMKAKWSDPAYRALITKRVREAMGL